MFVSFSVENYRSYKNKVTFDFIKDRNNPISKENLRNIGIILGGNASGKSNLFKAIHGSQNFILNLFTDANGGTLPLYAPYDNTKPIVFEYQFLDHNDQVYIYKFAVSAIDNNNNNLKIEYEALLINNQIIFDTQRFEIIGSISDKSVSGIIEQYIKNNKPQGVLLLNNIFYNLKGNLPPIIQFLYNELNSILCADTNNIDQIALFPNMILNLQNDINNGYLIELLKMTDNSIKSIQHIDNNNIFIIHEVDGAEYSIHLSQETGGLVKLLKLYVYYSKSNFKYFFIDELDVRMHYMLIRYFIKNIRIDQQWAFTAHNIGVLSFLELEDNVFYTVSKYNGVSYLQNISDMNIYEDNNRSRLERYMAGNYDGQPDLILSLTND